MSAPSNAQPAAPRSLYHKERPAARTRSGTTPQPVPPQPDPAPRRKEAKPGMVHLLRSLRIFGLVFAGMALLLMMSMLALRIIWAIRDRELKTTPQAGLLGSGVVRPAPPAPVSRDPATAEPARPAAPELDTERIRRAVFLARHAQALEEGGSLQEAITRYREALEVWPHLSAVWGQLGRAHLKAREFVKAQIALEKAVQGSPATAELMNDLGAALLFQGQIARAIDLFEAAVEIDPAFPPSYFNLALCHMARNDRVAARSSLQHYLRLRPNDARALRELAFLDALEGQHEAALRSLDRAIAESPDWALLYFDYAAVCALMGRMDQAIAFLQKAEPLSNPRAVYQIYREPAFREIRLTELGKEFERDLAQRARARMGEEAGVIDIQPPSEPLFSSDVNRAR
jgi:tetratricopeptide (TPR) repeat protein